MYEGSEWEVGGGVVLLLRLLVIRERMVDLGSWCDRDSCIDGDPTPIFSLEIMLSTGSDPLTGSRPSPCIVSPTRALLYGVTR